MPGATSIAAGNNERAVPSLHRRAPTGRLFAIQLARGFFNLWTWRNDMTESEAAQQAKACVNFEKSIGRPVLSWPYGHTRETRTHRRWRMFASVVHRFRLYADALPI